MNVQGLDLNLLRVFDTVLRDRSVTAAAKHLGLTLPSKVARVYQQRGNFKSLPPPVPIPPADVAAHWHERFERDPGNRWLREMVIEMFTE